MKRILLVCIAAVMLLSTSCYKDEIDDLQKQIDELSAEQKTQAEQYQALIKAVEQKLAVTGVTQITNGSRITFSDGSSVDVMNGTALVSVDDLNGQVSFRMSDGGVITLHKVETIAMYILSEGSWGQNNSDLAYYDLLTGTLTTKYFKAKNGESLGDTGNDLKRYGSKLYCTVSGMDMTTGGFIKVIDPKTGMLLKSIATTTAENTPDMPRRMVLANGKVYIAMYSGAITCVDTATLEITSRLKLSGTFSEGICVYGNNLYVCNSGQGPGNTISVVNMGSFTETEVITVANNPVAIEATPAGDIYFTTADYTWGGGKPSNLYKFKASDTKNITTFDIRASRLAIGQDNVYTIDSYTDWTTYESETYVKKININTGKVADFITDGTGEEVMMGYNISINPTNGDIYITNQGQDIYAYSKNGTLVNTLKTKTGFGSSIVFINQ